MPPTNSAFSKLMLVLLLQVADGGQVCLVLLVFCLCDWCGWCLDYLVLPLFTLAQEDRGARLRGCFDPSDFYCL